MASAECSEETKECTRRVFEAVNQNSGSLLKSARKTYSVIQLLTSLAECNEEGETPLAIAIKSDDFFVRNEIICFLELDCNIKENQLQLTFVFNQLLLHKISIKELMEYLILHRFQSDRMTKYLMFIAKIFHESNSLTRQDKIILLEMIGTVIITQLCHAQLCHIPVEAVVWKWNGNCGLECWRKAMTLRYFPTDGGSPLPKLPNVPVPSLSSSVIFESAVEVATIEELDLLQEDFERNFLWSSGMRVLCIKRMVIQALFVIRRISDQEDLGHPHWLYLQSLFDLADVWRFENYIGINLYLFILEELNGLDPYLFSYQKFHIFYISLDRLSNYFVDHLREPSNSPRGRELNYANLLMITKWITSIQFNHPDFQNFKDIWECRVLEFVYRLVFILNSISSRITSEEQKILKKFYCDYLRNLPERTATVLHEAVSRDILYSNVIPNKNHARLQTIERLLQFGADPNAIDKKGQTPLHRLAETTRFKADESVPLFQVLLDAGAHIDAAGDDGKTALCILKEILWSNANGDRIVHPYFESLINSVFPLSCYCARVIRRHGVPFEDRLPPRLKKLVSSHSAKASIDLHQPPPEGCNNNST